MKEVGVGDMEKIYNITIFFFISRFTILSRFFVMLVLLFCKLSEQYSQTNFPIIKPFKVTKKGGKKEWQIFIIIIIIIICYIYIVLFWVLKALYIEGGNLLNHHQCAASTWMMMRRQPYCTRTPTTHQLIGGEETEWWSQSVYGDD